QYTRMTSRYWLAASRMEATQKYSPLDLQREASDRTGTSRRFGSARAIETSCTSRQTDIAVAIAANISAGPSLAPVDSTATRSTPLARSACPRVWYSFRKRTSSSSWPINPTTAAIWATESQDANTPNPSGDIARAASENMANASAPLPTFKRMVPTTPRVTSRWINWRME